MFNEIKTFASYEKLVFDQLGIDAYENSSWEKGIKGAPKKRNFTQKDFN